MNYFFGKTVDYRHINILMGVVIVALIVATVFLVTSGIAVAADVQPITTTASGGSLS